MIWCNHPNMQSTVRRDFCPDCKYEFYYGDAHAAGDACASKLINAGRDVKSHDAVDDYYVYDAWHDDDYAAWYNDHPDESY